MNTIAMEEDYHQHDGGACRRSAHRATERAPRNRSGESKVCPRDRRKAGVASIKSARDLWPQRENG